MLLILAILALVVIGMLVFAAGSRSPQARDVGRRGRRIGLGVFFGSVAVNAGIGIYAVLTPHFGETAGKILVTSLCVTGAILVALVCEPAWERRLLTPVPVAGALLGALAFAGLIVGLWTEPESATLGKLLASTFAAAIGCTLASVIVLERERKRISLRHRRAIVATLGVIAFDVAVAVAVIWIPEGGPGTVGSNLIVTGVVATVACILVDLLTLLHPARPTQRVIDLTLGLIVLAATVAVALIWADASEHTAGKFAGTCLVAAAACILAGVLTLFHPAPPTQRVLTVTLGLVALAATVAVALIWTEASGHTVGNFAGTCGVAAAACILAALLTHARLAPAHRWVLTATLTLLVLGAVLASADIWLRTWGLTRAMGVVLIALAAFIVTVPVVHRLDRGAVTAAAVAGDAIRYCPHCGGKLSGEVGVEARCERCGRGFTVIDSERREADAPVAPGRLSAGRLADRSRRSPARKNVSKDVRTR